MAYITVESYQMAAFSFQLLWWISLRSGKYWIRNVRIPAQIQLDFLLVAVQQGLSKIHPNNYNFIWKNKCSLHVGNHILATVSDRDTEERIHYLFFPCHAILFSLWFRLSYCSQFPDSKASWENRIQMLFVFFFVLKVFWKKLRFFYF
jgi:hypothetical protein